MTSLSRLSFLLSMTAGYVDTAGFLALHGLFTAHVTGNFVTLGSSIVYGTSGTIAKLLALPFFCLTIALVRVFGHLLASRRDVREIRLFLGLKVILLFIACVLALVFGAADGNETVIILVGMPLVIAMAIQNAVQKIHLSRMPPTTVMTGTTTQLVIDAVDVFRADPGNDRDAIKDRMKRLGYTAVAFIAGCAAAGILFRYWNNWCFLAPPCLGIISLVHVWRDASLVAGE